MSALIRLLRRSPLLAYFVLVYAASGVALMVIGLPRLDGAGGTPVESLVMFPVIVIAVGLTGLGMTAVTEDRQGLHQLRKRLTHWRIGRWWLLLLLPPVAILLVLNVLSLFASPDFAPHFLVFGIAAGILAGFFEEIGWTGFAYPRMRARLGAFGGALLLGVLWALWHLPVIDSLGAASPHGTAWPAFFASFVVLMVGLRMLIAWLYVNTGSVLGAQLLHASSTGCLVMLGAPGVSPLQEAFWYLAYGAVLWLAVAVVVVACGPSLVVGGRRPAAAHSVFDTPAAA